MVLAKNKLLIILVMTTLVLVNSNISLAAELTFKEAIELGLKNNLAITKAESNVRQLQRDLKRIKAGANWQVDLEGANGKNIFQVSKGGGNSLKFSLAGTKSYWSGLTLTPQFNFKDQDLSQGELLDNNLNFSLSATQSIYPQLPVKSKQNYLKTKLKLQTARKKLADIKNDKLITWANNYLSLKRQKKRYKLAQVKSKLAQRKLAHSLAHQKINEVGKIAVLSAKANLKDAQYNLKKIENKYQQAQQNLFNQLGLSLNNDLVLTNNSHYMKKLKKIADSFLPKLDDKSKLIALAKNNNLKLLQNKINQQSLKYDLRWQKLKNKPTVNLNGYYDSNNWNLGIAISYNLFNGGKKELKTKNLTKKLNFFNQKYQSLIKDLKLKVDGLINEIKANKINLAAQKLRLKKARLNNQIAKKQFEEGLFAQVAWQEKKIALNEVRINWQAAKDKLLISKLELIDYIGRELK
ncbi:outer membrane protein [Halobacteroides halobius DSM 5150]|uniref:Outer membrane protein n=1 Tax=Halobacteroides halobius (strain ATCC 35273 / DSM 5150 / MD-1) TaxID=748449 RepID=L0K7S8_HALHC|nr:TolC family protein [Halobacteroides halobius]AGB41307.1 outer membrane protein [Halobacteroides halobius DSM 5150]